MIIRVLAVRRRAWGPQVAYPPFETIRTAQHWSLVLRRAGQRLAHQIDLHLAATRRRIWFPIYTASPQGHDLIGLCSSFLTTRVISRKRIAPIRAVASPLDPRM